jgi:hypothetical protein
MTNPISECWVATRRENALTGYKVGMLNGADDKRLRLTPTRDFLSAPSYIEAREGWTYFEIPLGGNKDWKRSGNAVRSVQSLDFGFDSWGAPPLVIWLDGVAVK